MCLCVKLSQFYIQPIVPEFLFKFNKLNSNPLNPWLKDILKQQQV